MRNDDATKVSMPTGADDAEVESGDDLGVDSPISLPASVAVDISVKVKAFDKVDARVEGAPTKSSNSIDPS